MPGTARGGRGFAGYAGQAGAGPGATGVARAVVCYVMADGPDEPGGAWLRRDTDRLGKQTLAINRQTFHGLRRRLPAVQRLGTQR
jgi:hypothetical protein